MNRAERRRQEKAARQRGHAGPALQLAMRLHSGGKLGEAERAYRRLLQTDPGNVGATHLLGVLLSQRGDHGHAVDLIRRSIRAHPAPPPSYHFNLGHALEGQGAFGDAIAAYRQTLGAEPGNTEALNNLGNALYATGETEAAFDAYRRALDADPRAAAPRRNLCERLLEAGQLEEAATVAATALAADPRAADAHAVRGRVAAAQGHRDDAVAAFRACLERDAADPYNVAMELARLGAGELPDQAPVAFIRRHYGERAATWDHTAESNSYRGHDLIVQAVDAAFGDRQGIAVLDLGCGTGELGRRLRPRAGRLDGVDLSVAMVTAAGHKNIYDSLAATDLLAFVRLAANAAAYDLVVAGAVLIHFKDLQSVFDSVRQALKPAGSIVFTVFTEGANQARSDFTCHTHNRTQVIRAAEESGLAVAKISEDTHETHQGRPVPCLIVTLRTSA